MEVPPLIVLGVSRSGTELLRVMLDRHSKLAIPDGSFFLPQLADRHRGPIDPEAFVDDLRRLPAIRDWAVSVEVVESRLWRGVNLAEAVQAIYDVYAERNGKTRWGDKTPSYMQHLELLERLFPAAQYVHLIRDGRDAALSFAALPPGIATATRAQPRDPSDFACLWRTEVEAARRLGQRVGVNRYVEVRYEALVEQPERRPRAAARPPHARGLRLRAIGRRSRRGGLRVVSCGARRSGAGGIRAWTEGRMIGPHRPKPGQRPRISCPRRPSGGR